MSDGRSCCAHLNTVFTICTSSLSNHGVEREVNSMFDVGAETLALPLSEKMKYEQGDNGDSFG